MKNEINYSRFVLKTDDNSKTVLSEAKHIQTNIFENTDSEFDIYNLGFSGDKRATPTKKLTNELVLPVILENKSDEGDNLQL